VVDPHLSADVSDPDADAAVAGSFKMNATNKKMSKLMKKEMKAVAEVCPQRSQHPDVDMGWRHCEICLAKFRMWTLWCVENS
jgi:K+-transporting ATPase c subunit